MELDTSSPTLLTSSHYGTPFNDDYSSTQESLFEHKSLDTGDCGLTSKINGIAKDPPHKPITNGHSPKQSLFQLLYSSEIFAKIWAVASPALRRSKPPMLYPEYTQPKGTKYVYRELEFWTSGFFPGSLYLLLEREHKFKRILRVQPDVPEASELPHRMQLEYVISPSWIPLLRLAIITGARLGWWTANLHQNASLSTTHDLGFMIFPWAKLAWDLDHNDLAYETIVRASRTLASRYVPQVGAIRSWDTCTTKQYSFTDPAKDFLLIIDNMMNLDMLFWAASELNDSVMYEIAVNHARKTQQHHIRQNHSTYHLVVFDPDTGNLKERLTNQGYANDSSWTRGQAWAITGFAQTFHWTRDLSFLDTAQSCADYFLEKLPPSRIPPWDFCAPTDTEQPPDTSAAIIAAYGMLLIHEARLQRGEHSPYFQNAVDIVEAVSSQHMNAPSRFVALPSVTDTVERVLVDSQIEVTVQNNGSPETILGGATINNFEFAPRRWANHGLVYADYYFLLVGNKLLDMGAADFLKVTMV